jgi:maltose/moltooligosaccharide transporter
MECAINNLGLRRSLIDNNPSINPLNIPITFATTPIANILFRNLNKVTIPMIAAKIGKSRTHMVSLVMGGFGLILMYFMPDKNAMILPMIFIGVAWASILAMPYSMLSGVIPADKMGVFMGIFNFFITLPQIVSALFSGPIVKHLFGGNAAYALMLGGGLMILAGILNFTIKNEN